MRRFRKAAYALILAPSLAGCAGVGCCFTVGVNGDNATKHVLVLGLGIISLPEAANRQSAFAMRSTAIGLVMSDQPIASVAAGYSSNQIVAVPADATNVLIEVQTSPTGDLTVAKP